MEEITSEKKVKKFLIASIVAILVIILAILVSITFNFNLVGNLVMSWILTTFYAIFGIFLIDPVVKVNPVRYIEKPVIQEVIKIVEKPIFKTIQIPMENRVIEVVDRPIIQRIPIQVPVERPKRVLNIPKFNFIGSSQTRTYHKRSCKFSKLIKKKYKLSNNSKNIFKKKHYRACKSCMKKK